MELFQAEGKAEENEGLPAEWAVPQEWGRAVSLCSGRVSCGEGVLRPRRAPGSNHKGSSQSREVEYYSTSGI